MFEYDEGMRDVAEDSVLRDDMIHLFESDDLRLFKNFHGIILISFDIL